MKLQWTLVISTSLISNNCLSRNEILVPVLTWKFKDMSQNIVEKRAIAPLFHNIFNMSLTSGVKLHIHRWMRLFDFLFSSLLQLWYFEVRISRRVSVSPLEFEITRVGCRCLWLHYFLYDFIKKQWKCKKTRNHTIYILEQQNSFVYNAIHKL